VEKMHSTMIIPALCMLFVLPGLEAASSRATASIKNLCKDPVYIWSVDSDIVGQYTVESGSEYTEDIHVDDSAGVAIKISRIPQGIFFQNKTPQLLFQYTAEPPRLWWNLHEINGHPFEGSPVSVSGCGSQITWPTGVDYRDPKGTGNGTVHCQYGQSATITLCGVENITCLVQRQRVRRRSEPVHIE
jgi:hypothetical protein